LVVSVHTLYLLSDTPRNFCKHSNNVKPFVSGKQKKMHRPNRKDNTLIEKYRAVALTVVVNEMTVNKICSKFSPINTIPIQIGFCVVVKASER
ncbi:hypothetical protein DOY81_001224, partial [Sarcophaga bullata]